MKPFKLFIIVSLVAILGGFVLVKVASDKSDSKPIESPGLQMDALGYVDYSDAGLVQAQKKGKSVLFFAATIWCQTCAALEEEILENLSTIPANVTILKVDYDNDRAMKAKFGVTSQHTLIVLDQNGKELRRWIGGGLDTLLQQVEKS